METGKIFPVCGNTYHMLHDTRFAPHFDFLGDKSTQLWHLRGMRQVVLYIVQVVRERVRILAFCWRHTSFPMNTTPINKLVVLRVMPRT